MGWAQRSVQKKRLDREKRQILRGKRAVNHAWGCQCAADIPLGKAHGRSEFRCVGKGSQRETGSWRGCIGKQGDHAAWHPSAPAASSQRPENSRPPPPRAAVSLPDAALAQIVKSLKRLCPRRSPRKTTASQQTMSQGVTCAIRIHANRCTIETLLTHLPDLKTHKQRPDHRTDRVLKVRNQLDRQEGKGPAPPSAYKTRNGNLLLPESGEQFNGIPPVRGDLSITIRTTADGAHRTNRGRKINLTGKKRFSVFPNGSRIC